VNYDINPFLLQRGQQRLGWSTQASHGTLEEVPVNALDSADIQQLGIF